MHIGDEKDLYFLVLTVILSYWCHKNGRLMPCSVSCHWWALLPWFSNGLCFPGKAASILCFQTKTETIIWKKKTRKQLCHNVRKKKLLNSSITATLKTAPSTGTREKSRLIKCVSIYISTFSAKYKIFLNILDKGDEIWMLLKFTVAFVLFSWTPTSFSNLNY